MSDTAKVVRLDVDSERVLKARLARLPNEVLAVHEKSKLLLAEMLKIFFDKLDDSFFNLADKAQNNLDQNLFFDAMREVRVQRRPLERRFALSLDDSFAKLEVGDQYNSGAETPISAEALTLVQNEELEEMVAMESMVAQAHRKFSDQLSQISFRLDSLLPIKVYAKNNPIGPDAICHALDATCRRMEMNIKVRLVMYKLFDKVVMSELGNFYRTINQLLVDLKVMPSLRDMAPKAAPTPAAPANGDMGLQGEMVPTVGSGYNAGYAPAGGRATGAGFNINGAMGGGAGLGNAAHQGSAYSGPASYGSVNNGPVNSGPVNNGQVSNDRMTPIAHRAYGSATGQQNSYSGQNQHRSGNSSGSFDDELADLLNEMVQGGSASAPSLLNNQTLPLATLVDVLSRVQRDAKVTTGIADVRSLVAAFSEQRGFTAQLNRMDSELINLVSLLFEFVLQDQNLASPIKNLISRLQIPIVKVALVDKGFFTQSGHVARRLLNELALAGVGWNGDLEDSLYRQIESVVVRIVANFDADIALFSELLVEFSSFIEREKRRAALFERRTLDAEDGKAKSDIARNKVAAEVGLRIMGFTLVREVKDFIQGPWSNVLFVVGLKQGLESADWYSCLQSLTDLVWSVQPPKSKEDRQALVKLVPGLLSRLRTGLDVISFNPFEMAKFFTALEALHMAAINAYAPGAAKMPDVAPVTAAELPVVASKPAETIAKDDLHWQQVAAFAQGSWFDFLEQGKAPLRCRLAAVIRQTGKYIFVNRSGVKVTEKFHQDLALALKSGELRPLDSSMLFDRALEEVVSGLRKTVKMPLDLSGDNDKPVS